MGWSAWRCGGGFWRWAAAFVLLASPPLVVSSSGAELKVKGETKVKAFRLVKLTVEGEDPKTPIDPKAAIRWRVSPNAGVCRAVSPRGMLQFVAAPGTYSVEVEAIRLDGEGNVAVDEGQATVVIEPPEGGVAIVPPGPPSPPRGPPEKADAVNAIVRLQFPGANCTATVIGPRRADGRWDVLTAAHCLEDAGGRPGTIRLNDGRSLEVTALAVDRARDVAWLVTTQKVDSLPWASLAAADAAAGTRVWHRGWGTNRPGSHERGQVLEGRPDRKGWIRVGINGSPGDSGSGIFREDTNELVAVLWGGNESRVVASAVSSVKAVRPRAEVEGPSEKGPRWP